MRARAPLLPGRAGGRRRPSARSPYCGRTDATCSTAGRHSGRRGRRGQAAPRCGAWVLAVAAAMLDPAGCVELALMVRGPPAERLRCPRSRSQGRPPRLSIRSSGCRGVDEADEPVVRLRRAHARPEVHRPVGRYGRKGQRPRGSVVNLTDPRSRVDEVVDVLKRHPRGEGVCASVREHVTPQSRSRMVPSGCEPTESPKRGGAMCGRKPAVTMVFGRAGDGARTRDIRLGRPTLYQLSYSRVPSDGARNAPRVAAHSPASRCGRVSVGWRGGRVSRRTGTRLTTYVKYIYWWA